MNGIDFSRLSAEDKAFACWLTGFIDGEGSLQTALGKPKYMPEGYLTCAASFGITLRRDDREILETIKKFIGHGNVRNIKNYSRDNYNGLRKPQARYEVSNVPGLIKLVSIMDSYPLRAKKRNDYDIWREAVLLKLKVYQRTTNPKWFKTDVAEFVELHNALTAVRDYDERAANNVKGRVQKRAGWDGFKDWLVGMVDGEGFFGLKTQRPLKHIVRMANFGMCLRRDDVEILRTIQRYFGCGRINLAAAIGKSKPQAAYLVSANDDLFNIIVPFFEENKLRAKKRYDFEIWKEGVALRQVVGKRPWISLARKGVHGGGLLPKWTEEESGRFVDLVEKLSQTREYKEP